MTGKPNGWDACPSCGDIIECFVPFKVPLESSKYNIPPQNSFTISTLLNKHSTIGLIIDLTNSDGYYNVPKTPNTFQHTKIKCEGHNNPPTETQVCQFISKVNEFIASNEKSLIGVHCTHGFNRTGFMVVNYLVKERQYSVFSALKLFAQKRIPGIYKQNYVDILVSRFTTENTKVTAAVKPCWTKENLQNLSTSKEGSFFGGRNVPGIVSVTDDEQIYKIRTATREIAKKSLSKVNKDSADPFQNIGFEEFIGEHPVSMTTKNMNELETAKYHVSWKADGCRYLMLVLGLGEVYMLDRSNSVFWVKNLSFWSRKNPECHLCGVLVDGEMISDIQKGIEILRYLIYDIIEFNNCGVGGCPFSVRQMCIEKELIGPRSEKIFNGTLDKLAEPFSVRLKQFWGVENVKKILFGNFSKQVSHQVDGLIFQPDLEPYHFGRSLRSLKWKPPKLNSVDFRILICSVKRLGDFPVNTVSLLLFKKDTEEDSGFSMKYSKALVPMHGKIVECIMGSDEFWRVIKVRDDKNSPNSFLTCKGVMESITNPVTTDKLIELIDNIVHTPCRDNSAL